MGKIKILMVFGNTKMGGVQAFILNVLRNIDRTKFQIDLAINIYAESNGIENECRSLGCNIHVIPYFKIYNYLQFNCAWNKLLKEHNYDIVYAHSTNSASVFLHIAQKHGCKTIAHSHSAGYRGNKLEQFFKRLFVRNVGNVSDYWFACSDKAAERIYGENYKKYPYYYNIPNAIDAEKYKFSQVIRRNIRDMLKIDESVFLCGHVGTFSVPKNHRFLIDVFYELLKKRPNSKLLCCGEGPLMQEIKEYAKKLGIVDKIIFSGVVANPHEYMMAMDVFVFPSLFEGFPISILEAEATGLPIVMSDVITNEVDLTDLICRHRLDDSLSNWVSTSINATVENREKYNNIIANSQYNMCTTVKTIESLFEKLIEL